MAERTAEGLFRATRGLHRQGALLHARGTRRVSSTKFSLHPRRSPGDASKRIAGCLTRFPAYPGICARLSFLCVPGGCLWLLVACRPIKSIEIQLAFVIDNPRL